MIKTQEKNISIFGRTSTGTLTHIRKRVMDKKPVFLASLTPMFPETVQMAFLLNEVYCKIPSSGKKKVYKTYFGNSGMEALHGAIKAARHVSSVVPGSEGRILIYDPADDLSIHVDPLQKGPKEALIPNVFTFADFWEVEGSIQSGQPWSAVILSADESVSPESVNRILEICRYKKIVSVIDLSRTDLATAAVFLASLRLKADIFIWGESLTEYQIPFGAFSVADEIFPWNSLAFCLLHSSTYGGNAMACSYAKEVVLKYHKRFDIDSTQVIPQLARYEAHTEKIKGFKKYINRASPSVYSSGMLDIDLQQSEGAILKVRNEKGKTEDIWDCVGGSGCSLRGHNPQDLIEEVLNCHDPEQDYWQLLSGKLEALTGYERCLPGVSGASAVENAITLAMAANPDKNKIIVFRGNYAGTSLIALNASDRYNVPFYPLYPEVVYINFFDPKAKEELRIVLKEGDVALVWFEMIQGGTLFPVPYEIIRVLRECKREMGYFIGIDEILNGTFRTGNFFSFDKKIINPDLVTISKGISDMAFPVSVALASEHIYRKASKHYPDLVSKLESYYLNQLGAHVALHGVDKVVAGSVPENVKKISKQIRAGLKNTIRETSLLKSVDGAGLHLQLTLALDQFPFNYLGRQWSEIVMTRLCYKEGKVLTFLGRLLPPLTISEAEAQQVMEGIDKAFKKPKLRILLIGYILKIKTYITGRASSISRSIENI